MHDNLEGVVAAIVNVLANARLPSTVSRDTIGHLAAIASGMAIGIAIQRMITSSIAQRSGIRQRSTRFDAIQMRNGFVQCRHSLIGADRDLARSREQLVT
jgi:hypothetical protein